MQEQEITKKRQIDKNVSQKKFYIHNNENKEYKVEAIYNNAVFGNKSESHLFKLYYMISWKRYLIEKNS